MNTNGDIREILPIYFFCQKGQVRPYSAHTTLKHCAESDYDIMNNQGDIAQNFENWPERRPSWI